MLAITTKGALLSRQADPSVASVAATRRHENAFLASGLLDSTKSPRLMPGLTEIVPGF
jgi:hypothetical protein